MIAQGNCSPHLASVPQGAAQGSPETTGTARQHRHWPLARPERGRLGSCSHQGWLGIPRAPPRRVSSSSPHPGRRVPIRAHLQMGTLKHCLLKVKPLLVPEQGREPRPSVSTLEVNACLCAQAQGHACTRHVSSCSTVGALGWLPAVPGGAASPGCTWGTWGGPAGVVLRTQQPPLWREVSCGKSPTRCCG